MRGWAMDRQYIFLGLMRVVKKTIVLRVAGAGAMAVMGQKILLCTMRTAVRMGIGQSGHSSVV